MEEEPQEELQLFHSTVREYIIFLLLFLGLYVSSYAIVSHLRRREREDDFAEDAEEITVHRISIWLCTFSLAISLGAVLLLPISIVSNEILLLYPTSYYVQWLNSSLIHGLWNYVFLFSNLSVFILLPFAYLFTESEGFIGHKKGIMARVYETFVVLLLLSLVVLGLVLILCAVLDRDRSTVDVLLNVWDFYLPFLYSCVSFLGVLLLLLCTPLGFGRLFTVLGQLLVKPHFLRDVNEEFQAAFLEENYLRLRLKQAARECLGSMAELQGALSAAEARRKQLDVERHTSAFQRNVFYPLAIVSLLFLTGVALLMVLNNTLQLLVGIKALPISTQEQFSLGLTSLSALGPVGAALEVVLIAYLAAASTVGLYTLPLLGPLKPRPHDTPLTHLILNCGLVLVLSSALPLLARTLGLGILGITNFDLLGEYGRLEWLGKFYIVFAYNIAFAVLATLCLANRVTSPVRRELYRRLQSLLSREKLPGGGANLNASFSSTSSPTTHHAPSSFAKDKEE